MKKLIGTAFTAIGETQVIIKIREHKLKAKTLRIEEKQLKELKEFSKKTGISEAKLVRIAIEDFLNNKERLKARLWSS